MCALKWSDFIVDGYEGILTISRSRSAVLGKGIVEGSTKNGRSRTIYMSEDMMSLVRSYCYDKRQEALDDGFPFSDYLFTNENGELMHPDTFTKYLRRLYDENGFPREYHLHTLRHYFVSTMLHNGVDKQTVAELAGHGDTGFLERTYCHPRCSLSRKQPINSPRVSSSEAALHRVPEDMDIKKALLIKPYSCAKHCVDRAQIGSEDIVVISGAGTLGLGMVSYARSRNPARLIALDLKDERLALARKFGADLCWNPGRENVVEKIVELTDGYGCDIYIEATGAPASVRQGMDMIRKLGRFVEFSVFGQETSLDWSVIGDKAENLAI